jgi:SAM-dependent methyltransferase
MAPSELHPLVAGFDDAETYDRGRPVYGESVARALSEALGLCAGDPVIELGAGTGQLSRSLLAAGLDLTAIEPLAATRALLGAAIGAQRTREGVAEQIPMPDGSAQAVLAAESFHWFDERRAMPEIKRVLAAGGGVGIMRTVPILDRPWAREVGELLDGRRPPHPGFDGRSPAAALEADEDFGAVTEITVTGSTTQSRDGLLAYFASISWVATMERRERSELVRSLEAMLDRHDVRRLDYELRHQIWTARLR